ncbi:hypothetical protein PGT21_028522 [Puccinia graminis f. sp. tritici]|uniref:Uncharacterized protein n=1 Tax=Puccinia graminis f. sp. tritici TaxID=56615 RepID=A0A5B0PHI1_PUCGR|nr:hypothetical protein PGT21_028522 [Puccinia graminis f. sp. tritici]
MVSLSYALQLHLCLIDSSQPSVTLIVTQLYSINLHHQTLASVTSIVACLSLSLTQPSVTLIITGVEFSVKGNSAVCASERDPQYSGQYNRLGLAKQTILLDHRNLKIDNHQSIDSSSTSKSQAWLLLNNNACRSYTYDFRTTVKSSALNHLTQQLTHPLLCFMECYLKSQCGGGSHAGYGHQNSANPGGYGIGKQYESTSGRQNQSDRNKGYPKTSSRPNKENYGSATHQQNPPSSGHSGDQTGAYSHDAEQKDQDKYPHGHSQSRVSSANVDHGSDSYPRDTESFGMSHQPTPDQNSGSYQMPSHRYENTNPVTHLKCLHLLKSLI